jgi:hypothetical protein
MKIKMAAKSENNGAQNENHESENNGVKEYLSKWQQQ